ncbi:hypothetical protein FKM82_029305 [Ascaphus truei]
MRKNEDKTKEVLFIMKFNGASSQINNIVNKHWGILQCHPILKNIITERPKVGYRRENTFTNVLAPTLLRSPNNTGTVGHARVSRVKGFYKCGGRRVTCNYTLESGQTDVFYTQC